MRHSSLRRRVVADQAEGVEDRQACLSCRHGQEAWRLGRRHLNTFGLVGYDAAGGKELWRIPWTTGFDVNICTPPVLGDRMFVASANSSLDAVQFKDGKPPWLGSKGKERPGMTTYWPTRSSTGVPLRDVRRSSTAHRPELRRVKTGKLMWSRIDFGKAAITLADGHLWIATRPATLCCALQPQAI